MDASRAFCGNALGAVSAWLEVRASLLDCGRFRVRRWAARRYDREVHGDVSCGRERGVGSGGGGSWMRSRYDDDDDDCQICVSCGIYSQVQG